MAHDLLVGIVLREVPHEYSEDEVKMMANTASVLCWILGHEHNKQFGDNLEILERDMRNNGYVMARRNN